MREVTNTALQFVVHLGAHRGVTPEQVRALERGLFDYADRHDLVMDTRHGTVVVTAEDRQVTTSDQVQLLDWLVGQPAVDSLSLGPLTARGDPAAERPSALLAVRVLDLAVIGVTLLYRSGNLCPELYLQILRGSASRVALH